MTTVRRKVAVARKTVMSLIRLSQVQESAYSGTHPVAMAASSGNASRKSFR